MHGHGDHHGHGHGHQAAVAGDRRLLGLALAIIASFMLLEVVAGILAGSLALLSDAAHMLTDAASLALALLAARLAARPPGGRFTFGLGRAEILSAQANGATLLVLGALIAWEAIHRLASPPEVEGAIVLAVGLVGAGVNVTAAWTLSRAQRQSLNVRGAMAHLMADLYASLAAAASGALVLAAGWTRADGVAALVVAVLMVRSGWRLVRDAGSVLLEAAPEGFDPEAIGNAMARHPGVVEVHDLHVWEVTSGFPALSAHVLCRPGDDCHALRNELETMLHERFGVDHTTLQVDHEHAQELLDIADRPR